MARSFDNQPWRHPFLTAKNIRDFRAYSEQVWQFATESQQRWHEPLDCAFYVNMAQNMNKWASMLSRHGVTSTLYTNPMDAHPFSNPAWEFFDGDISEWQELSESHRSDIYASMTKVPWKNIPLESQPFLESTTKFDHRDSYGYSRSDFFGFLADAPTLRYETLRRFPETLSYFDLIAEISRHKVCYAASNPVAAYASGIPYCASSVGGDLQSDCGSSTNHGTQMVLAFAAARFLMLSNPHTLGHSRRLGLINGLYLPYPMDTGRYSPGYGRSRSEWVARAGDGLFVLVTSRVDAAVKGFDGDLIRELLQLLHREPRLRLVFTDWGENADLLRRELVAAGIATRALLLPAVGKERLIDYYRSCDLVLDQLVYGYYGATALEAASVGKPVLMFIRRDQYNPLYKGESAPLVNVSSTGVVPMLAELANKPEALIEIGESMRAWVLKHHGESKTAPLLLALLQLAASGDKLPSDLQNPLRAPITEEEEQYHNSCLVFTS